MANEKIETSQNSKNLRILGGKVNFFNHTYIEKTIKWLILITFISIKPAFAVDDDTFLLQLNKCVINQLDMGKSEELKVLIAPSMSVVCSRGNQTKILCKVMEKDGSSSTLVAERDYVISLTLGDTSELKGSEDSANLIVINRKQKKALYQARVMQSQTLAQTTICSGTYKDQSDLKKIMKPSTDNKPKGKPQEITPAMIGE